MKHLILNYKLEISIIIKYYLLKQKCIYLFTFIITHFLFGYY